MNEWIYYALLGLGAGALYAALAQGLVVAYRGAGVVNLSHGAIAMYAAYTFAGLRQGRLMVPPIPNPLSLVEGIAGWFGLDLSLPDLVAFHELSGPMGVWPAFSISVAVSAVLGLALHLLVFRPLRAAPPLAKTVASVGVLLVLQAIVILRFGTEGVRVQPFLSREPVSAPGGDIPQDRFILLALTIVLAVALSLVYRYTRLGLATRAAAENERGAMLLGLSPNRLAAVNWVISAVVAGAAGVMFASITGLNPTDYVMFVVPALGAALVARLEWFGIAAAVGVLIGAAQSTTVLMQSKFSWFPETGAAAAIPFIVIIVAMIASGARLPERGALVKVRLPAAPEPSRVLLPGAVATAIALVALVFLPSDLRGASINSLTGVVLALSLVVVVGLAGQISLMQMAIAGLAAFLMTRFVGDLGWPFPLGPAVSIVVAGACGVLAGLPALRVRGIHLAVVTLGAGYTFEQLVLQNGDYLRPSDASQSIPPPSLFGFDFGVNGSVAIGSGGRPNVAYGIFVLLVTVACAALVVRIRRSDLGRQLLAVRANERAAAALGVNVASSKLVAFVVGALLAGTAGMLSAYQFEAVTPEPYVALASVSALAVAYLGGISTVSGAVAAGLLATGGIAFRLVERYANLGVYEMLVSGVGLVLTAVLNPEGIAGVVRATLRDVRDRLGPRLGRPTTAPGSPPTPAPAPAAEPAGTTVLRLGQADKESSPT